MSPILWSIDCEPYNGCGFIDTFLPIKCGDVWRLPFIDGDISLIESSTNTNLGVISSSLDESSYSFSFKATNIQPTSILKLAYVCDCVASCSGIIERSSYGSDTEFLEAVGIAFATELGGTSSVQDDTVQIFYNDFSECLCDAIVTSNTNFTDDSGVCNLPNISEGCIIPISVLQTVNNCTSEQVCVNLIQVQGVDVCIYVNQPVCISGVTTILTFPSELDISKCYHLLLEAPRDIYCSQPFQVITDDCFYPMIRARNNNEPYIVFRIGLDVKNMQIKKDRVTSKDANKYIKNIATSREKVYDITTDYYTKEVHEVISDMMDKNIFEIYLFYSITDSTPSWHRFVSTDDYIIEWQDVKPSYVVSQAKTKITEREFYYTNNNCN